MDLGIVNDKTSFQGKKILHANPYHLFAIFVRRYILLLPDLNRQINCTDTTYETFVTVGNLYHTFLYGMYAAEQ